MGHLTAKLKGLFTPLFANLFTRAGKYDLLVMKTVGPIAKWAASVGGVTVVVGLSFSASAYTSFIQVYNKCQTQEIASNVVMAGKYFAWSAISGATIVLIGLSLPYFSKLFWYSSALQKARKKGDQVPDLELWCPSVFTARAHSALIIVGTCVVLAVPFTALSVAAAQTPEALAQYARNVDAKCAKGAI